MAVGCWALIDCFPQAILQCHSLIVCHAEKEFVVNLNIEKEVVVLKSAVVTRRK